MTCKKHEFLHDEDTPENCCIHCGMPRYLHITVGLGKDLFPTKELADEAVSKISGHYGMNAEAVIYQKDHSVGG